MTSSSSSSSSSSYSAQSERLWLEPLSVEKHIDDYHALMIHPQTPAFSTRCATIAQSKEYMLARLPHAEKPWIENYAVLLRPRVEKEELDVALELKEMTKKPKLIGVVGVIRFQEGTGAEVGYGVHPEYQGRGYATEALRLFGGLWWGRKSMFCFVLFCFVLLLFVYCFDMLRMVAGSRLTD
ncbi:hypothetical protein ACMFMG_007273 [Clarireedia jacksonii]